MEDHQIAQYPQSSLSIIVPSVILTDKFFIKKKVHGVYFFSA